MRTGALLFLFVACTSLYSKGQDKDSLLLASDPVLAELDSILNSADSLTILDLIDSILQAPVDLNSQLAVRMGYNSNVVSGSRTVSINKFGLSPGVSYYHKSGFYADASSYWSRQYSPNLYLTILSAGYMGDITSKWSLMAEYSRYFYTPITQAELDNSATDIDSTSQISIPYTNNIFVSNFFEAGKFLFRLDYSFLFGKQAAHRIAPVITYNFKKKKVLGCDRIAVLPSVSLLLGNETVFEQVPNFTRPIQAIQLYRLGRPLYTEIQHKVWGIMNYSISVPLIVTKGNWSASAGYVYNFPQSLPGEETGLTHGGYITVGITRYFEL